MSPTAPESDCTMLLTTISQIMKSVKRLYLVLVGCEDYRGGVHSPLPPNILSYTIKLFIVHFLLQADI